MIESFRPSWPVVPVLHRWGCSSATSTPTWCTLSTTTPSTTASSRLTTSLCVSGCLTASPEPRAEECLWYDGQLREDRRWWINGWRIIQLIWCTSCFPFFFYTFPVSAAHDCRFCEPGLVDISSCMVRDSKLSNLSVETTLNTTTALDSSNLYYFLWLSFFSVNSVKRICEQIHNW